MGHGDINKDVQDYLDRKLESMLRKNEEFETRIELQMARQSDEITEKLRKVGQEIPRRETQTDIQRIEVAINEWTKSIEDQLNVLMLSNRIVFKVFD